MVSKADQLAREEYPGELQELRAIRASIAQHGCLECQLRASIASQLLRRAVRPLLRLVVKEGK